MEMHAAVVKVAPHNIPVLHGQKLLTKAHQQGCPTKDSYNANAVKFANTVDRKNNVSFVARNGTTYKYNKNNGTFAIITKRGIVVTYFKPKDGYDYYKAQIERVKK